MKVGRLERLGHIVRMDGGRREKQTNQKEGGKRKS
jgi:hypothetical protein